MEFVLDNEIGRHQPAAGQWVSWAGLARAIKTLFIVPFHSAEEAADFARPGHRGELIDRSNEETRQATIDWLIDSEDRKGLAAAEIAMAINAVDAQIRGMIAVGLQFKRVDVEFRAAPRAVFQRDRRGLSLIVLVGNGLCTS